MWVAHRGFDAPANDAIPLVLFEAPCIFRTAALSALDKADIPWRVAFSIPSLAGLRAAVRAGLGISVRTARWLEEDLTILRGMPALSDVELAVHTADGPRSSVAERLLESVRDSVRTLAAPLTSFHPSA